VKSFSTLLFAATVSILFLAASFAAEPQSARWPEFRGPTGQGIAEAKNVPAQWSETSNVAWKTPLEGRGWSSPVVENGQAWVTAGVDTPVTPEEKARRLAANTGDQPLTVSGTVSLRAQCVDLKTGKLLHDIEVLSQDEPEPVHSLNSYASPTPVLENGRLYCHFGTYGTGCVDTASGKVLWTSRNLRIKHENGPGSSPISWGSLLIIHYDGSDQQYVAALGKETGEIVWRTSRTGAMRDNPQMRKAYGTPIVVEMSGRPALVSPGADWLYAYDPATGEELWKVNYGVLGFSIVPRPVVGHGMIYMCTSFMQSELLAIRYDGKGESKEPHIAWRFARQAPQIPSPLLVGNELYLISDKGVATCLDARNGEVHWSERIGGNYSASPIFADGKIYFSSREGRTSVVAPGTSYKLLASNELDGKIMASPVACDGMLLLRTDTALYRIGSVK
jgi:outer membrane protein assembly factor BamB